MHFKSLLFVLLAIGPHQAFAGFTGLHFSTNDSNRLTTDDTSSGDSSYNTFVTTYEKNLSSSDSKNNIYSSLNIDPPNSPILNGTWVGHKNRVESGNGLVQEVDGSTVMALVTGGTVVSLSGQKISVTAPAGVARSSKGLQVIEVQSRGTGDASGNHEAVGIEVGGVYVADGTANNKAYGFRINDSISATGTQALAYSLANDSLQPSYFLGKLSLGAVLGVSGEVLDVSHAITDPVGVEKAMVVTETVTATDDNSVDNSAALISLNLTSTSGPNDFSNFNSALESSATVSDSVVTGGLVAQNAAVEATDSIVANAIGSVSEAYPEGTSEIQNAVAYVPLTAKATGTGSDPHVAAGVWVGRADLGGEITASGSSTSNLSAGVLIDDTITATGTLATAWAVKSNSVAPSVLAGKLGVGMTTAPTGTLTVSGHTHTTGTAPTVGSCGTSPSVVGTDTAGKITIGTGGVVTGCVLTFATTWTNAPMCFLNDETQIIAVQGVPTTTTLTINVALAFTASSVIDYHCIGRE
jgi:hypothetical protein